MSNKEIPFDPEDEKSGFIPPDARLDENQADEERANKLERIQISSNLIEDASSYFDAIGLTHPQILQEGNEARVLDLLRRYYEGAVKQEQQIETNAPGTIQMRWEEKAFVRAHTEALKRILDAHESKQTK